MESKNWSSRIGIIGALDLEIESLVKKMDGRREERHTGFVFYYGKLRGHEAVVVKCGVGKVNASMCTQMLISKQGASSIIFTGVAGSLSNELDIADVVISTDCIQHDIDASALGFERGRIPYTELSRFESTVELCDLAMESAKKAGIRTRQGRILSGDQFISDKEANAKLRVEFGGECVDMESAAVAHVCTLNNVPHVIIRSISDKADGSAHMDFPAFCAMAARNSFLIVDGMLDLIGEEPLSAAKDAIKEKIRTVPDWPKKGIMFRDITTLIKDDEAFSAVIGMLEKRYANASIDTIAGIESRGFIIGAALAARLGMGFVPIRKAGKLPAKTVSMEYELEYGRDRIEIHEDAIKKGSRVLLVDDLIATGGTALAACRLIEKLGGKIAECAFVIDLPDIGGRKKLELEGYKIYSLIEFEGG